MTDPRKARFEAAQALLAEDQAEAAEALIRQGPVEGPLALLLGLSLDAQNRPDEAMIAYEAAGLPDPLAVILRAKAAAQLRNAEAGDLFAKACRTFPDHPWVLAEAAAFHLDRDALAQAEDLLAKAVHVDPNQAGAWHNLAIARARLGEIEAALIAARRAFDLNPEPSGALLLAQILVDVGAHTEAEDIAGEYSSNSSILAFQASVALEDEKPDRAAALAARALALDPSLGNTWLVLALALDGHGLPKPQAFCRAADLGCAAAQARARLERTTELVRFAPLSKLGNRQASPEPFADLTLARDVLIDGTSYYVVRGKDLVSDLAVTLPRGDQGFVRAASPDGRVLTADPPVVSRRAQAILWGGSSNYYHWLVDDLPRWPAVAAAPRDLPILLNRGQAFQDQTLSILDLPLTRIEPLAAGAMHLVDACWIAHDPNVVRRPGGMFDGGRNLASAAKIAWLRARFPTTPATRSRRLFIARGEAPLRRLVNEDEVAAHLVRHGFETMRLEGMDFADQILAFAEADAVVAIHGAGLANLVFARTGARVLELHPPGPLPAYFRAIAAHLGLDHKALPGQAVRQLPGLKREFWHFRLSPHDLDPWLEALKR